MRMAFGASRRETLCLVMHEGLEPTAAATAIGLVLAVGVAEAMVSVLYEVEALDPLIFGAAPLVLVAASGVACLVPALRASRIDPLLALEYE